MLIAQSLNQYSDIARAVNCNSELIKILRIINSKYQITDIVVHRFVGKNDVNEPVIYITVLADGMSEEAFCDIMETQYNWWSYDQNCDKFGFTIDTCRPEDIMALSGFKSIFNEVKI